jgi:hypothetical protein
MTSSMCAYTHARTTCTQICTCARAHTHAHTRRCTISSRLLHRMRRLSGRLCAATRADQSEPHLRANGRSAVAVAQQPSPWCVCVCVRACVRACARACVRACVHSSRSSKSSLTSTNPTSLCTSWPNCAAHTTHCTPCESLLVFAFARNRTESKARLGCGYPRATR